MEETIKKNNAFFRELLFIVLLVTIGLIIFKQLAFFVGAGLGAITLYIVFRKMLFRLTEKFNWPHWLAALVLVLACAVILVGLGYGMVKLIAAQIPSVDASGWMDQINGLADKVNAWIGEPLIPANIIEKSGGVISKVVSSIFNTTYSFVANILFMLLIVYFMFASGRTMERNILRYLPFSGESLGMLRSEVKNMVYSNAVGIPLVMLGQTIVASIVYWAFGIDNYMFWGFLTAICGLVPLIGTGLVYIPMAIVLAVQGNIIGGILMILAGLFIIGMTDNLIRIGLMHRVADTHPLIVIFGVLLGIPLFGFWGIIFGPLLISGFLLLIKIFYIEYGLIPRPPKQEGEEDTSTKSPLPAKLSRSEKLKKVREMKQGPPRCKPGQSPTPGKPCAIDDSIDLKREPDGKKK